MVAISLSERTCAVDIETVTFEMHRNRHQNDTHDDMFLILDIDLTFRCRISEIRRYVNRFWCRFRHFVTIPAENFLNAALARFLVSVHTLYFSYALFAMSVDFPW